MRTNKRLIVILLLFLAAPAVAQTGQQTKDDKQPRIKVANDAMIISMANGENLFVDSNGQNYQFVINLNMRLPNALAVKESLLTRLAQDKENLDALVFVAFTPSADDNIPNPVEVAIGDKIPLKVAQAILAELGNLKEMKFAVSVEIKDGGRSINMLNTRRVVVGSFKKTGKEPVTAETLKSLLDPNISHADFVARIQNAK